MRTKLSSYALVGALGLSGVAGAALVVPAVAYAATGDSTALDNRVSSIRSALAGLVSDDTLTEAQADAVATTLAEAMPPRGPGGPGGHGGRGGGMHLQVAAEALGMSVDELRAAAADGKTLADLAADNGVTEQTLIDALVAAHEEKLDAALADGRLTQPEADEKLADARTRITERLDEPIRQRGHGRGPR